jgi:hypothetical protein
MLLLRLSPYNAITLYNNNITNFSEYYYGQFEQDRATSHI